MAGGLGRGEDLGGRQPGPARLRRREAEVLRARDAALPLGRAPRRPPQVLRGRRRDRPLPPPPRLRGDPPDGLRRLRPAGREQRDQDRRAAAGATESSIESFRDSSASGASRSTGRASSAPTRPSTTAGPSGSSCSSSSTASPTAPRRRCSGARRTPTVLANEQVVDGRCERCGTAGRAAQARAVVLQDHRLRRAPARRLRPARVLARARDHDAAQLDRPLRGRRGRLPLRGARPRLPGLHDPARHALRRHLLRARPRAPRARAAGRRHRGRGGGARVRQPGRPRVGRGARRRGPREDRRAARPQRRQSGQRRADPDVRRRLRADGVRHRRDHGGARPRRARLRVRQGLRPADPAGDRGRATPRRPATTRACPTRATGRWSTPAASTARATARPTRRSSPGSARRAAARRRSTTACATGWSRASATGARRSRSSTATSAGWSRCPTTSCRSSCPRSRTTRRKGKSPLAAAEDWVATKCPTLRRPGAARDRHDGHLRRLLLVLHPLPRPAQRRARLGPRGRRSLAAGRPVHRRRRARDPAPDVRALLRQGARRPRPPRASRSRSPTSSPRG